MYMLERLYELLIRAITDALLRDLLTTTIIIAVGLIIIDFLHLYKKVPLREAIKKSLTGVIRYIILAPITIILLEFIILVLRHYLNF